jgi:Type II CAAX prenyl endopeptidase Rce1-like
MDSIQHPYFELNSEPAGTGARERRRAVFLFSLPLFLNGFYNPWLAASFPVAFWSVECLTWIVLPLVLFHRLIKTNALTLKEFSISIARSRFILFTAVLTAILFALVRGTNYGTHLLPDDLKSNLNFGYYKMLPETGLPRLFVALFFALTAGVWEEFFYRVLTIDFFENKAIYCLVTATGFAILHFEQNLDGILTSFFFGLAAAMLYARYRQAIPLMFAHFAIDFILFFFSV